MDIEQKIEHIYTHIEKGEADKAVRACLYVSRHIKDYFNTAFFLQELFEDKNEILRILIQDATDLKPEALSYIYQESLKLWLQSRKVSYNPTLSKKDGEQEIFSKPVGEIAMELEQYENIISDLKSESTTHQLTLQTIKVRQTLKAARAIQSRILNRCFNYAIEVQKQLEAQQKTNGFLAQAQNEVQNYFKGRSEDVYEKLQKANQLVDSTSSEDCSLLLTQVRRAIKSVADHFYPAVAKPVTCSDGEKRKLGDDQYLNRLEEFIN